MFTGGNWWNVAAPKSFLQKGVNLFSDIVVQSTSTVSTTSTLSTARSSTAPSNITSLSTSAKCSTVTTSSTTRWSTSLSSSVTDVPHPQNDYPTKNQKDAFPTSPLTLETSYQPMTSSRGSGYNHFHNPIYCIILINFNFYRMGLKVFTENGGLLRGIYIVLCNICSRNLYYSNKLNVS